MDGKPGLFNLLGKRMEWLGQRQKVLAQNIANADTPDYVPHDLKPQEFRRLVERQAAATLPPAATRTGHIPTSRRRADARSVEQKERYATVPAGSAGVKEGQVIKVAKKHSAAHSIHNLAQNQGAQREE